MYGTRTDKVSVSVYTICKAVHNSMNKILMYTVRTCYIAGSLGIEKNICGYFVFDHNSKIDEWISILCSLKQRVCCSSTLIVTYLYSFKIFVECWHHHWYWYNWNYLANFCNDSFSFVISSKKLDNVIKLMNQRASPKAIF